MKMEDSAFFYLILTLFSLNYVGIGAIWSKIDKICDRISAIEARVTIIENKVKS